MYSFVVLIGWAFFGLVVGAIARLLLPGRQPLGIFFTMVLGIVGSIVGGLGAMAIQGTTENPYHPAGWFGSIVGAVVVLWVYTATINRRLV